MALGLTLNGKFGIFRNIPLTIHFLKKQINFKVIYGTHKYYNFDFDPRPSQG